MTVTAIGAGLLCAVCLCGGVLRIAQGPTPSDGEGRALASVPSTSAAPTTPATPTPSPEPPPLPPVAEKITEKNQESEHLRSRRAEYQAARDKYEAAALEWHARNMLKIARQFTADAQEAQRSRRFDEADKLNGRAHARYTDIIAKYPDTLAAKDARELQDGEEPPEHPVVSKPVPPLLEDYFPPGDTVAVEQKPDTDGLLRPIGGQWQVPPTAAFGPVPAGHPKPVYVRGYVRRNGTYVAGYSRAAPGFGRRR